MADLFKKQFDFTEGSGDVFAADDYVTHYADAALAFGTDYTVTNAAYTGDTGDAADLAVGTSGAYYGFAQMVGGTTYLGQGSLNAAYLDPDGIGTAFMGIYSFARSLTYDRLKTSNLSADFTITLAAGGGKGITGATVGTAATQTYSTPAGNRYDLIVSDVPVGLCWPDLGAAVFKSPTTGLAATMMMFDETESGYDDASGTVTGRLEAATQVYFCRAYNYEGNYSGNSTFIEKLNDNTATEIDPDNPTTYITGVGLFNDDNELLAIAKLSEPVSKTFENETTIKVKIAY
jgi:hypothetical protein